MSYAMRPLCARLLLAVPFATGALHGARAQNLTHAFEGTWIWDRAAYVPPPNDPVVHMVTETMSVARDDGTHYSAKIVQTFDTGETVEYDEDLPEDGAPHRIGSDDPPFLVSVSVAPDGSRHIGSGSGNILHESVCTVSDAQDTLTCTGTHVTPDGARGTYVCVYHRDRHAWPVAMLRRLIGFFA